MFEKVKKYIMVNIVNKDTSAADTKEVLRLRESIKKSMGGIALFKRYRYNKICYKNNAFLPLSANIGENTYFPHGISGIFISQGAVIGDNCTIFHQVTIGSNNLKDSAKYGAPVIGNNVYIGAGAKIIGCIKVGDNVRIGANATIVFDVPDNSTVVAEKARVIIHDSARDNTFRNYKE